MCMILTWLGFATPGVVDRVEQGPSGPVAVVEWDARPGWWFGEIPGGDRYEGERICRIAPGVILSERGAQEVSGGK